VTGPVTPQNIDNDVTGPVTPQNIDGDVTGSVTPQNIDGDVTGSVTPQNIDLASQLFETLNEFTVVRSAYSRPTLSWGRLGSCRVVNVLDSGAEGLGFKSQSRRCWVTVLGKLFISIVLLFTKQRNW